MAYKIKKNKTFKVTSKGMAYSYNIKAKNKQEAEKKYMEMFKDDLTGEEEIIVE